MTKSVAALILSALLHAGCTNFLWKTTVEKPGEQDPVNQVPNYLKVLNSAIDGARFNHFQFKNESEQTIFISYKDSLVQIGSHSYRVVPGETRAIHDDQTPPDRPIAPLSIAEISFYSDDPQVTHTMVNPQGIVSYRVSIRKEDGGMDRAVLYRRNPRSEHEFTTEASQADKIACYVTGILYGGWCWFIQPKESDRTYAQKRAQELFGGSEVTFLGRTGL